MLGSGWQRLCGLEKQQWALLQSLATLDHLPAEELQKSTHQLHSVLSSLLSHVGALERQPMARLPVAQTVLSPAAGLYTQQPTVIGVMLTRVTTKSVYT